MKDIILILLIVISTQVGQAILIINNQHINPMIYVIPFDLAMLLSLFWVIDHPNNKNRKER